jgi:hypothetical protein
MESDLREHSRVNANSFFPCPGFYRPKIETVAAKKKSNRG